MRSQDRALHSSASHGKNEQVEQRTSATSGYVKNHHSGTTAHITVDAYEGKTDNNTVYKRECDEKAEKLANLGCLWKEVSLFFRHTNRLIL